MSKEWRVSRSLVLAMALLRHAALQAQEPKPEAPPAPTAPAILRPEPPQAINGPIPPEPDVAEEIQGSPTQQIITVVRPMILAELNLIQKACKLTKEQREALARDTKSIFTKLVDERAELDQKNQDANPNDADQQQAEIDINPYKVIRQHFVASVRANLPPEGQRGYEAELQKRDAYYKRISLEHVLTQLDDLLLLSDDQYDRIDRELTAHNSEPWCPSLDSTISNRTAVPDIPEKYLFPYLTPGQKKAWKLVVKQENNSQGPYSEIADLMSDLPPKRAEAAPAIPPAKPIKDAQP